MNDHKRLIGFSFAWNGLREVYKTERNFRLHLVAALFVVVAGWWMRLSRWEWIVILLVISFVLLAEMINSALEKLVDHLQPDWHPVAKVVKDVAAGAVLIAAITAVIIGCIIFIPKFIYVY
ncbi:MAG TPA: diacylglycerol kinase family protein [Bacillota bacterium]